MYKILFINFGYFSQNEGSTFDEAVAIARRSGFQSRIDGPLGPVASWCPLNGLRRF